MTRVQGVFIAVSFTALAGLSGTAQSERAEIVLAAVDAGCETASANASAAADRHGIARGTEQTRLNEYLSLHAEVRHDSGLVDGMPWPAPRLRAN